MSIINITDKLAMDKPVIQIGDKKYTVNNGMATVLKFEELMAQGGTKSILDAINLAVVGGFDANDMSLAQVKVIMIAISAAMQGVDYEVAEARFHKKED